LRARFVGALAAPALVAWPCLAAQPPREPILDLPQVEKTSEQPSSFPSAPPLAELVRPLDLAACQAIAAQQQPAIRAAQASLEAALVRARGLDHLRIPTLLARDLPTRRKQAAIGISVAEAGVHTAANNTRFAVTWCYLAALYANEQETVLRGTLADLEELRKATVPFVTGKGEDKDVDAPRYLAMIDTYRGVVRARIEEAVQGRERALSGLREALGLPCGTPIVLSRRTLFDLAPPIDLKQSVALGLARRPELIQATYGVEVSNLEVCAQGARHFPSVPTFASGSDIHAQPLPAGVYDNEYKPGAIGPEMPATMNGPRADRVEQARVLAGRADLVTEKVRNLIVLEVEQAYLRWSEAARQLPLYREASQHAQTRLEEARKVFRPGGRARVNTEQYLGIAEQATRVRLAVNESRYHLLLALARLERATAQGCVAGFESAPFDAALPEKAKDTGKEQKPDDSNSNRNKTGGKGQQSALPATELFR
jgi:outer membrane protein TolC